MFRILNPSSVLSSLRQKKLEHGLVVDGLFVGVVLVLVSAAMTGSTFEIITSLCLIGASVAYLIKERSVNNRTRVAKPATWKCQAAEPNGMSDMKSAKLLRAPAFKSSGPSGESARKFIPRVHHAEPRVQPSFPDDLPLCKQVDQFLQDVLPSKVDYAVCKDLARLVAPCVKKLIPEAQIDVVAQSSIVRIGRTGYRPEVEILVTVPPKVLAHRLLIHMRKNGSDPSVRKLPNIMEADENTLNRYAIRILSAQLTFCKLWRTAAQGVEMKAVLSLPKSVGILSEDMRVHVFVNCPNPVRSRDVFNQSDAHVQRLMVFVRRWTQDRCIALRTNTSFGHMPLYAWSLWAMNFCNSQEEEQSTMPTIELFAAFVDYCIKWHDSSGQVQGEPFLQIQDPCDENRNVAECMTPEGMKRVREELERAKLLLGNGSSLTTILETGSLNATLPKPPC